MDTQIWVAIIGAIGAVSAAVVARGTHVEATRTRLLIGGGTLAVVGIAAFAWWLIAQPDPDAEFAISEPRDGAQVEMSERVSGSSAHIDTPERVMLVTYWPGGGRFYPLAEPLDFEMDGEWSVRASIGQPGDVGVEFDLIMVLNDDDAHAELETYVAQVRASGGESPGLESLPDGSRRLEVVSVVRADG